MGDLVTARTAPERLGVDVRTLYAYVSRGALRREPGPDGRSSRYDSDELDLLARRSRPRTLPPPAPAQTPPLHRFATALAATAGVCPRDVAASVGAVTPTPDWPSCGRRVIG